MQNAAKLKTHLDAHKQEIEELKNELAASRAQVLYNCYNRQFSHKLNYFDWMRDVI